jgi:competence protein ComEC
MLTRLRAPALVTAGAWVAGILLADRFHPPPALTAALLAAAGVPLFMLTRRRGPAATALALPFLFAVLFGATLHGVQQLFRPAAPADGGPVPVLLTGVLESDPSGPLMKRRCLLAAERVDTGGGSRPCAGLILLTLRHRRSETPDTTLGAGMRVRVRGRLERPPPAKNPGEFDRRAYYEANGIVWQLLVRRSADIEVIDTAAGSWISTSVVMPVRRFVLAAIDRLVGGEEGALLKGILLGERADIGREVREAFTVSGTAHVLAVSGSNVAVVAGAVYLLLGVCRAGRVLRAAVTAMVVLLYMAVTGGQPPVVRAAVMALVLLAADVGGRPKNTLNAVGIAALVMLLVDTRQVGDVGFQLSFAAVLSLVVFTPVLVAPLSRVRLPRIVAAPVRAAGLVAFASLAATLGTLPLTALHFGRVSVIGLAANILVVPLVGAGVVVGGMMAMVVPVWESGGAAYAALARLLMQAALWCTGAAASVPWASWELLTFRNMDAVPYYCGVLLCAAAVTRSAFVRILLPGFLLAMLLAILLPDRHFSVSGAGVLRVSFIDVGQGDAILIEPPGRLPILIDAGPWSPEYDAGRSVVVPFLRRRGIERLGMFIPTHAHADHLGGAAAVLNALPVGAVVFLHQSVSAPHESLYHAVRAARGAPLPVSATAGEALIADSSFALEVLWTPSPFSPRRMEASDPAANDASLVCRLRFGVVSILLTGDAGAAVEERLLRAYGEDLRADVLKVAHHGSASASTMRFLEAVRPALAVIQAGAGNRFGHPSPKVLERLEAVGAEVLRTDRDGAIILESDGRRVTDVDWR